MSILTNQYRNKKWVRPIILGILATALGAAGVGYVAPVVVPVVHELLCGKHEDCAYMPPIKIELPKK